jgi:hypothetical protein
VCTTYTHVSASHKTPAIFASIPLRSKRLDALPDETGDETGLGGVFFDYRSRWQPAAGKDLGPDEVAEVERVVSHREEAGIPLVSEVLEGADRNDAVDGP